MGGCCVGNCCVAEWIRDVIGGVLDIFGGSSGGGGYVPSGPSESEAHAKKIADELAEMKESIRTSSEKKELQIIDYVNTSVDELIKELQEVNKQTFGGKSLYINIQGIREKSEKLKKEVVGSIGDMMDGRLVLTDKELSLILEERKDDKRAKNFNKFCLKVQKQALASLREKISSTIQKQEEMIEKEISARLSEVDKSMKETEKAYQELLEAKESGSAKMDGMQIKYMYKYELESILLEDLECLDA